MGAWIEINFFDIVISNQLSLPPWERGLKSEKTEPQLKNATVAPPVGAWIEIFIEAHEFRAKAVAPPVGAWIEI